MKIFIVLATGLSLIGCGEVPNVGIDTQRTEMTVPLEKDPVDQIDILNNTIEALEELN